MTLGSSSKMRFSVPHHANSKQTPTPPLPCRVCCAWLTIRCLQTNAAAALHRFFWVRRLQTEDDEVRKSAEQLLDKLENLIVQEPKHAHLAEKRVNQRRSAGTKRCSEFKSAFEKKKKVGSRAQVDDADELERLARIIEEVHLLLAISAGQRCRPCGRRRRNFAWSTRKS